MRGQPEVWGGNMVGSWQFNPFMGRLEKAYTTNDFISRSLVNGSFRESIDALVTSDGATVTLTLTASAGGDLTMQFSDGDNELDVTPGATIVLTAGSDASPTKNFIYIPQSTKVLTKSTSSFPAAEHIKVGFFLVPSAGFVQSDGAYVNQNWNDHLTGTDNQGHLLHIAERSRRLGAQYFTGVDGNGTTSYLTIIANAGSADDVFFKSTAGIVYQMHSHTIPAMDTSSTDKLLVVNQHANNGGSFDDIANLNVLLKDANDVSMSGKYFNLTFIGVANKTGEFDPFMVNLPTGSYNRESDATNDVSGFTVTSVPSAFNKESSTAFEISIITLRHQVSASGTWTHIATKDLRGLSFAGAGAGVSVLDEQFADNIFKIFDEADVTKEMAFDVGTNITTGNTRTYTVPDSDGTMALIDFAQNWTATQTFGTTTKLQFGDSGTFIHQSADGAILISSDGTITLTATNDVDVTNDLHVAGEMKGSRMVLGFNEAASHTNASFNMSIGDVPIGGGSVPTQGYRMPRAGSIVGVSLQIDITTAEAGATMLGDPYINTSFTNFRASVTAASTGIQGGDNTQARGTDTFNAGDYVMMRVTYSFEETGITGKNYIGLIEVQFDT